ncbi:MAG: phosphotransferase, partial [Anaerolineae bacterium]
MGGQNQSLYRVTGAPKHETQPRRLHRAYGHNDDSIGVWGIDPGRTFVGRVGAYPVCALIPGWHWTIPYENTKRDLNEETAMPIINIREAFTGYLRQQLGLSEFNISHWERIADGWETDVYAYQLMTPQRSEDKILRIFMGDSLAKARREYYGMSALDYLGFAVPKVSHLCEDASIVGGPFILMQRIFGQPTGRVMHQDPALFSRFMGLMVEYHQLSPVPLHELVPDALPVTNLADAWAAKLVWARQVALDQYRQT